MRTIPGQRPDISAEFPHGVRSPEMPDSPTLISKMEEISTTQIFGHHCLVCADTRDRTGGLAPCQELRPGYGGRPHLGRRSVLRLSHHALSAGYRRPFALLAAGLASAIAPAQTVRRVPLRRTQGRAGNAYYQECSQEILRVHSCGAPPGRTLYSQTLELRFLAHLSPLNSGPGLPDRIPRPGPYSVRPSFACALAAEVLRELLRLLAVSGSITICPIVTQPSLQAWGRSRSSVDGCAGYAVDFSVAIGCTPFGLEVPDCSGRRRGLVFVCLYDIIRHLAIKAR